KKRQRVAFSLATFFADAKESSSPAGARTGLKIKPRDSDLIRFYDDSFISHFLYSHIKKHHHP
ncbi:hypothetical protein, partial [Methylocucumis oryzae]